MELSMSKEDVLEQIRVADEALGRLKYALLLAVPEADRFRFVIDIQNEIGALHGRMLQVEHVFAEIRRKGEADLRKAIDAQTAQSQAETRKFAFGDPPQ